VWFVAPVSPNVGAAARDFSRGVFLRISSSSKEYVKHVLYLIC